MLIENAENLINLFVHYISGINSSAASLQHLFLHQSIQVREMRDAVKMERFPDDKRFLFSPLWRRSVASHRHGSSLK